MLGVALLVFREVLEASLIISIVCAATRGVARRGLFVTLGLALGILGALLVAMGAGLIARAAQGSGQEIFDACVLVAAVLMIGWHVLWMSKHGREGAKKMMAVGDAVRAGSSSLTLLLVVVALAVLREGSEVALFLYGMVASGIGLPDLVSGMALGIAGGALSGVALYFGLLHIPTRHFFNVTNWMLVLLAAGLASAAARFLIQADFLPSWGTQMWNTSWLLSNGSLAGKTLGVLIGYDASPAGMQIVFYLVTLISLSFGVLRANAGAHSTPSKLRSRAANSTAEPLP